MYEKSLTWAADFESTVEIQYLAEGKVRVWAWAVECLEEPERKYRGETIDEFFEFFKGKRATIYFHNLKFDGSFILDYLLRKGYPAYPLVWKDKPTEPHVETLIDGHGQFYWLQFIDKTTKTNLNFKDSLKKYRMELEKVAKIFKIPGKTELKLGYRPLNREVIQEEWDRVEGDVRILATAMRWQMTQGLNKLTIAADAKAAYERIMGREVVHMKHPHLPEDIDALIRPGYRGGWTFLNPIYKEEFLENVWVLDVNSMYPGVMSSTHGEWLPYGFPRPVDEDYQLREGEVDMVLVDAMPVLKEGAIPWIHYKHVLEHTSEEYIYDCERPLPFVFTRPDLDLFDLTYESDYWNFKGRLVFKAEQNQFTPYISYWNKIKQESDLTGDEGMRQLAKDMMNNLSGRFALNPNREGKLPSFDPIKNKIVYTPLEVKTKPWYVPTSAFITANARKRIVMDAMKFGDDFVYADTDSLHIINGDKYNLEDMIQIDPRELGYYKIEEVWKKAKYLRPKAYYHEGRTINLKKKDKEIKCGGLPEEAKKTLDLKEFFIGAELEGKKAGKVVPGGYLLKETTFKIKKKEWGYL